MASGNAAVNHSSNATSLILSAEGSVTPTKKGKHDPEARKKAIVNAAAKILAESGDRKLTHRLVAQEAQVSLGSTTQYFKDLTELKRAGYERLAKMIDEEYADYLDQLESSTGPVSTEELVRWLCDYLDLEESMRSAMTLYAGALKDPQLRSIAKHSNALFERVLSRFLDQRAIQAVAMLIDGAIIRCCVFDETIDREAFEQTIRHLISARSTL